MGGLYVDVFVSGMVLLKPEHQEVLKLTVKSILHPMLLMVG